MRRYWLKISLILYGLNVLAVMLTKAMGYWVVRFPEMPLAVKVIAWLNAPADYLYVSGLELFGLPAFYDHETFGETIAMEMLILLALAIQWFSIGFFIALIRKSLAHRSTLDSKS